METFATYLHFLTVFVLCSLLAAEFLLCNEHLQPGHLSLLLRIDAGYLVAVGLSLVTGFLLALADEKGAWFYFANPLFWIKLVLLLVVATLSVFPTLTFIRWNRAVALGRERILGGREIVRVRKFLASELALMASVPLVAVLVARAAPSH